MGLFGPSKKKLEQLFQEGYFALHHDKTPGAQKRAEELLGRAAKAGHPAAMFHYGQALDGYSTGIEAMNWAEKSGEAGYDEAILYCLDHYISTYLDLYRVFRDSDPDKEPIFTTQASQDASLMRAQCQIWARRGVEKGLPAMREALAALQEEDLEEGLYRLALAYELRGRPYTALEQMTLLARKKHLPAMLWCARILASGAKGTGKGAVSVRADRKEADKWLIWAARPAQALLEGETPDPEKACELYLQIADAAGAKHDVSDGDKLSLRLYTLAEAFFVRQQYQIALPLMRYAAGVGYIGAYLRMAQLLQLGLPDLDADHEAAVRQYREWYGSMKPGSAVQFGAYPRKAGPDAYDTRADFDPLFWQVLEVKDGRVLLLCYKGLEVGDSGTTTWRIFDDFEQPFAEAEAFNLTEQEFERYVAGREWAAVNASTYAAANLAELLGLTFEIREDGGVLVQPKEAVDYDDPAQKQEWEGRRGRVGALLMKPAAWALEGGRAVADGKVQTSAEGADVVLRPAVWVRMPPPPDKG